MGTFAPTSNGLSITQTATQATLNPKLTLTVYEYGVILHTGNTSYAVDPRQVAEVLAASMPDPVLDTGMIGEDVLRVWQQGKKKVVISYRKPQRTGIWLDGESAAYRVPMPGLLMARTTTNDARPAYKIVAAKRRPQPGSQLYHAPFPNVHGRDGSCWGTVAKPSPDGLRGCDLSQDWANWLGSHFGNHSVVRKSQQYPDDLRKLYRELHDQQATSYPYDDLVPLDLTFGEWMEKIVR